MNRPRTAPVGRDVRARTTYRSFYRMDLRRLAGRSPAGAKLRIPAVYPNRCGTRAPAVAIWETADFNGRTSWNRQPKWRKRLAVARAVCNGRRYEVDVSALIAAAVKVRRPFLTLGVLSTREGDRAAFVTLGNAPTITVALKPPPAPPVPRPPTAPADVISTPGGACAAGAVRPTIGTTRPTLSAKIHDPDSRAVGARFEWRSLTGPRFGGHTGPMQAAGSRTSTVAPADAFFDGYSYAWRVQGFDERASGPWSPWCEFTVELPAAALPDPEQPPVRPGQPGIPSDLKTLAGGTSGHCGRGADQSWIGTSAPQFRAEIADDAPGPLRATFEWIRVDGTKIGEENVDEWSGNPVQAWTAHGAFVDGTYAWHVRVSDETGPGPWSPWCQFTVDITRPATLPTVTSTDFPKLVWSRPPGVSGTFHLTGVGDPDVVKFLYELDNKTVIVGADRPGGTASFSFTPPRTGPYTLKVRSMDRAGNVGEPVIYDFFVNH
ncbi:hypothetical protein [Thermomonospora umbrina]|uniref:hypothetical protein n=1 Tax=Thermomonospora umbrina TaxID=111806 RepID=UPI000E24FDDC|nr:hypothetical protein [Thermomonospora umbrina]